MAEMVGLQLLLQPGITSPVFRIGCGATAILYPLYQTYKVLDISQPFRSSSSSRNAPAHPPGQAGPAGLEAPGAREAEQRRLLTYWASYSACSLVFDGPLSRVPYYYHAKFCLLVWLHHTGATTVFKHVLQPALKKYEPKLDICLAHLQAVGVALYSTYRVPINAGVSVVTYSTGQLLAFLRWFLTDGAAPGPGHLPDGSAGTARGGAGCTASLPTAPVAGGGGGGGLRGLMGNAF